MRRRSNIFSIAPGVPFLSTLVDSLKQGRLIADFDATDPLELSRCTFYVPTRRAALSLRTVLIESSATQACLLPAIHGCRERRGRKFLHTHGGSCLNPAPSHR